MNFPIESGRLFHNIDAEKDKVVSPFVTEFTVGIVKSSLEDDLRTLRCGWYFCRRDDKKAGQSPWIILKVMSRPFNIIRDSTGSQWSSRRAGNAQPCLHTLI